jgi:uroporphyrin-3 C-methyltransferase
MMRTDELMGLDDDTLDSSEEKPRRSAAAALALFLAVVAMAFSGWVWWEGQENRAKRPDLQPELSRLQQSQDRQADNLSALGQQVGALEKANDNPGTAALESEIADQQARTRSLQQELQAQQTYARSLQQAVEALQSRLMAAETTLAARGPVASGGSADLDLESVGYLLRLAPERLALFHDLASADQALAMADAQLATMNNPVHIGVRQRIADARKALSETEFPNEVDISAELDAVQSRLAELTFGSPAEAPAANGAQAPEQGWWDRLKASLAGLVTVRHSSATSEGRLTFEDKDLLRQGLWMQVEGARLALMRHDQAAWDDALARAIDVLQRWFDETSPEYRSVFEQLQALAALTIAPQLPDISGPWAQLQLIRQAHGVPAPAAPEVAEPQPDPEPAGADQADEPATADADAAQADTEEGASQAEDDSGDRPR